MPIELIVTNIGLATSLIIVAGMGVLVFVRRLKGGPLTTTFTYFCGASSIWLITYGLGLNLHDPYLSRFFS